MISYREQTDETLLSLLKREGEGVFVAIYERYFELLYRHAYRMVSDAPMAQDVVQDVFSRFWEKRTQLEISSLSAYLYASTRHAVLKVIRKSRNEQRYVAEVTALSEQYAEGADVQLQVKELQELIEAEIDHLPERMKEVFRLSRLEHRTHKEIASQLGISENTVKNQIGSSLSALRKKLNMIFFLFIIMCLTFFWLGG